MTEKNQGAAEWLRGIADKYEAEGSVCSATAKLFGLCCDEAETCKECRVKAMRAIADRIDREMVELPKDAEGEPIHIGDVLFSSGNECRVVSITVKADEACVGVHTDEGAFLPSVNPKYLSRKNIKPLESEVLDADGVPIEVGDTVYCDDDPEQLIVDSFDDPGCVYLTLAKSPNGMLYTIEPSRLSHERPDSWERIEDDAKLAPRDYLEKRGMNPEKTERIASMMADLVRRAKALAKAGEQG